MKIEKIGDQTFKIDRDYTCPVCETKLNAFSNVVDDEQPKEGDLTICYKCTSYLKVTKDLNVELLDVDELCDLPSEQLNMLIRTRNELRKVNAELMNEFKPYFPNWIDTTQEQREIVSFFDTSDLLKIEHVQLFTKHPDFTEFVISDDIILALLDNGKRWMMVGAVKDPSTIKLPKWSKSK